MATLIATQLSEKTMNDNLKRYLATVDALMQLYVASTKRKRSATFVDPRGVNNGIVGSGKTQLPAIANKMSGTDLRDSQIQQFRR